LASGAQDVRLLFRGPLAAVRRGRSGKSGSGSKIGVRFSSLETAATSPARTTQSHR
jgi:hypothetical protein